MARRRQHPLTGAMYELQDDGQVKVEFQPLNLSSLGSAKTFAENFTAAPQNFDLLINNAGVMMVPSLERTTDGFQRQFGTNHLGHFALTGAITQIGGHVYSLSS